MLRCIGYKQVGGICSDPLCKSKHWSPLTHYHGDGVCSHCGKPEIDVLVCNTCDAIDPFEGYGRFADKDGSPCGRLYDPDEESTETLAEDSTDEYPPLEEPEQVGWPLVKSPPLSNCACVCEPKVILEWRHFKGYADLWARCVKCSGWCKKADD
jgi:hypothetical protein